MDNALPFFDSEYAALDLLKIKVYTFPWELNLLLYTFYIMWRFCYIIWIYYTKCIFTQYTVQYQSKVSFNVFFVKCIYILN